VLALESVWRRPYTGAGRRIQLCEGQTFSVQNIVQELTRDHITVAIQARNLAPGMNRSCAIKVPVSLAIVI